MVHTIIHIFATCCQTSDFGGNLTDTKEKPRAEQNSRRSIFADSYYLQSYIKDAISNQTNISGNPRSGYQLHTTVPYWPVPAVVRAGLNRFLLLATSTVLGVSASEIVSVLPYHKRLAYAVEETKCQVRLHLFILPAGCGDHRFPLS